VRISTDGPIANFTCRHFGALLAISVEIMSDNDFRHRAPYSNVSGDVEKDTLLVRQHKDSMQRYSSVFRDEDKDRYLRAEDGKLGLLKVQLAPGYTQDNLGEYSRTWSLPRRGGAINAIKRMWRNFRNAPKAIVRWTYGSTLGSKRSEFDLNLT
jgi:hypothetical protein